MIDSWTFECVLFKSTWKKIMKYSIQFEKLRSMKSTFTAMIRKQAAEPAPIVPNIDQYGWELSKHLPTAHEWVFHTWWMHCTYKLSVHNWMDSQILKISPPKLEMLVDLQESSVAWWFWWFMVKMTQKRAPLVVSHSLFHKILLRIYLRTTVTRLKFLFRTRCSIGCVLQKMHIFGHFRGKMPQKSVKEKFPILATLISEISTPKLG